MAVLRARLFLPVFLFPLFGAPEREVTSSRGRDGRRPPRGKGMSAGGPKLEGARRASTFSACVSPDGNSTKDRAHRSKLIRRRVNTAGSQGEGGARPSG
ncbi:MAG: hypothetical protein BJ554DRAFT_7959 [Olpidium bornovanus]|uniref:Secreted protein n=1 Tax=Olpidium bornovanus TaxID=278681 RepID=A0A8H8DIY6_9FUNG|nr:MAG: hypothetical protein BJ554DRAFT_7959 [Olpidium bornovanus]